MKMLRDCINEATSAYWLRRSQDFLNARPRIGDFHGQVTPAELRQRWEELTEIADACRARAQVSPLEAIDVDVPAVWREAS